MCYAMVITVAVGTTIADLRIRLLQRMSGGKAGSRIKGAECGVEGTFVSDSYCPLMCVSQG
jgi:hypothetical protein